MRKKAINITPMSELISKQLEDKGMSQAELARLAKMSTVTINDLLANRRTFTAKNIVSLSIVLGLDAIEFGRMQSDYEIMQVIQPLLERGQE